MNDAVVFAGRTQEEILKRIEERKLHDPFGFEIPYYMTALSFENAKPHLLDEITEADWNKEQITLDDIREQMARYMPFAWEKANNRRGISANRSIAQYQAWLWLLGVEWCDSLWDDYKHYGKPQLIKICEYLGLDHKKWDNGERVED